MAVQWVTNAGSLATRKRMLAGQTEERFRQASQMHGDKMKEAAVKLSSGYLSSAQQRRMGHPYATRYPANYGPLADYVINVQSGRFRDAWTVRVQKTPKGWTVTLINNSPEAKFMQGTQRMRLREILAEVQRRTSPGMPRIVGKVIGQAIRENSFAPLPGGTLGAIAYAAFVGVSSVAGAVADAA